jgi:hypothetical protein
MASGDQVIAAIVQNQALMNIGACPTVPVEFSRLIHGQVQNDSNEITIQNDADVANMLRWGGMDNQIGLWHITMSDPVHHFVIMPWVRQTNTRAIVYTVFMAYEQIGGSLYTVGNYVAGAGAAPNHAPHGYRQMWTAAELMQMFADLRQTAISRATYFGVAGNAAAAEITCAKYSDVKATTALRRL